MNEQALEQLKQYFSQGRLAEVETGVKEHLKQHPQYPILHKMLGICLFQRGEFSRAQLSFEQALELQPGDTNSLNNLGNCYLFQNQHYRAADYFKQALLQGDNPEWHRNLGTCYFELGLFRRAAKHYYQAIEGGISDDAMLVRQIDTLKNASRFKDAIKLSEKITDEAQKLVEQAAIHVAANRPQQAKACLARVEEQFHFSQPLLQRLHDVYRFLGDRENELKIVNRFVNGNLQEQLLASVMQPQLSALQLVALEQDPRLAQCNNQVKATFYFILAGHYKDSDKTRWLELLKQANRIQAGDKEVDISTELNCFSRIKQFYPGYADFKVCQPSNKPVFIIGMPRSGTTLIESILGNHSEVFAAGESTLVESLLAELNPEVPQHVHPHQLKLHYLDAELNVDNMQRFSEEYLNELNDYAPEARYVTDKMPHNFMHLGWLAKALPEATFIHCQRDPVATCLSIFEQNFSSFHLYGNDFTSLVRYYQQYQALMAFWYREFGQQIITIRYEDLVRKPEDVVKPLLQRLKLEWQEGMLDLKNTDRSITTSSLQQVRKGIYLDALNSYAGMEEQLSPLMTLKNNLAPWEEQAPVEKKTGLAVCLGCINSLFTNKYFK